MGVGLIMEGVVFVRMKRAMSPARLAPGRSGSTSIAHDFELTSGVVSLIACQTAFLGGRCMQLASSDFSISLIGMRGPRRGLAAASF